MHISTMRLSGSFMDHLIILKWNNEFNSLHVQLTDSDKQIHGLFMMKSDEADKHEVCAQEMYNHLEGEPGKDQDVHDYRAVIQLMFNN